MVCAVPECPRASPNWACANPNWGVVLRSPQKGQCADKKVQHVEARSQEHIKSSLPYDFPLGFYREGTILPVSVAAGLLPLRQDYCARRLAGHGCCLASRRHCPGPGLTWAAACVFTGSSPAHSQGVTCAFTGHAACVATLGRPRAPQLPRAQAPGSRPYAATARRP